MLPDCIAKIQLTRHHTVCSQIAVKQDAKLSDIPKVQEGLENLIAHKKLLKQLNVAAGSA
jgi:hypothetical protein